MDDMRNVATNEDDMRFIRNRLFETKAFNFLPTPVILASGQLGIYYINTEKLLDDGDRWKEFWTDEAKDAQGMIAHAAELAHTDENFEEVIDILCKQVSDCFPVGEKDNLMIAGGERRDWLFSGPVADKFDLSHVILYKQEKGVQYGRADVLHPDGRLIEDVKALSGLEIIHIGDLLTSGSSTYNADNTPPTGWVPTLRKLGATVGHSNVVVNRNQRDDDGRTAVEKLALGDITGHALITVDDGFFRQAHTEDRLDEAQQAVAVAYQNDPAGWCHAFLRESGITPTIVSYFNPDNAGSLVKAGNFVRKYRTVLEESGRLEELNKEVQQKFGGALEDLVPDSI